ncbi:MAG: hypothetical protein QW420_01915 [Candidatus Caldarchaeum sp.]
MLLQLDKFAATQASRNMFAFKVCDIGLERLRIVGGDISNSGRCLPKASSYIRPIYSR